MYIILTTAFWHFLIFNILVRNEPCLCVCVWMCVCVSAHASNSYNFRPIFMKLGPNNLSKNLRWRLWGRLEACWGKNCVKLSEHFVFKMRYKKMHIYFFLFLRFWKFCSNDVITAILMFFWKAFSCLQFLCNFLEIDTFWSPTKCFVWDCKSTIWANTF